MDSLIAIFNQLGVDGSILYQFILFFVLYFVVRSLLFKPLLEVIEMREGKTTKLDNEANHKFEKAKKLEVEYKDEIDVAYTEAGEYLNTQKHETSLREKEIFKTAETKINAEFEKRREVELAEIESKRAGVLKSAQTLSGELVQKLTN